MICGTGGCGAVICTGDSGATAWSVDCSLAADVILFSSFIVIKAIVPANTNTTSETISPTVPRKPKITTIRPLSPPGLLSSPTFSEALRLVASLSQVTEIAKLP